MARSPAGPLIHEHRTIDRMVELMRGELDALRANEEPDLTFISRTVDFIRSYADRSHHGKEEEILFRRLAEKDLHPEFATMMQELVDEHALIRRRNDELEDASWSYSDGNPDALDVLVSAIAEIVDVYPMHVEKEERRFFKEMLEYLDDEERASILAEYAQYDSTILRERYESVVEEAERTAAHRQRATV